MEETSTVALAEQQYERLLQLNELLLNSDSATFALEAWCSKTGRRRGEVRAERLSVHKQVAGSEILECLKVRRGEAISFRRVRLVWNGITLSQADNWYRPELLSDDMNNRLANTSVAFGRVVETMQFRRKKLAAHLLWSRREDPLPEKVLHHTAVLESAEGVPFSMVKETYLKSALLLERHAHCL